MIHNETNNETRRMATLHDVRLQHRSDDQPKLTTYTLAPAKPTTRPDGLITRYGHVEKQRCSDNAMREARDTMYTASNVILVASVVALLTVLVLALLIGSGVLNVVMLFGGR